jgi:hypothetical protein
VFKGQQCSLHLPSTLEVGANRSLLTGVTCFEIILHRPDTFKARPSFGQVLHCTRPPYAQHIEKCGKKFFQEICRRDWEGAKRKPSTDKDDGIGWIKIKNRNYSQAEGRHELLTRAK